MTYQPITQEQIDILNGLPLKQKEAIYGRVVGQLEGRYPHVWYPDNPEVFNCPSTFWRDNFGSRDQFWRDICTIRISADFSVRKGVCQAFIWRPGLLAVVLAWKDELEKSTPEYQPKDCDVRCVTLNRAALEARAKEGHMGCMALLRKAHIDEHDDRFMFLYEHYGRSGNKAEGREFVRGVGLQQFSEPLRQELVEDTNTVSVDIVNCAVNLLTQVVDVELPAVTKLVGQREEMLQIFADGFGFSRGSAKTWALAMMGGAVPGGQTFRALERQGTPLTCMAVDKRDTALEFSEQFIADVHHAAARLCEKDGICPDGRARYRYLALKVQAAEDKILQACSRYHEQRGEEVTVLIFDGYYVRGLEGVDSVDLADLEAFVHRETGFRVRFAQKAIDGRLSMAA